METESPVVYSRLFKEESWKDLVPDAVHGSLRQAAQEFFISAVPILENEDKNGSRIRQTIVVDFYQRLNSDFSGNSEDGVLALSQPETNYGVLLMKLASTPSGPARDGLLRDLTLAREKLVRKEERAPATTVARSLVEKIGWHGAAEKLQPGSSGEKLQAIEQVVLQKLGHQDLRSLFESQAETPRQVLEKFMGRKIEEIVGQKEQGLIERNETSATPGETELSKNIFSKISRWLRGVDWKFVGRGSASMLAGIGLGELLGSASWIGGVLLGVNMLFRRAQGAENVEDFIKSREAKYPRASEKMGTRIAMGVAMGELKLVQAALRVVESPEAMFVGAGLVAGAGIRQASGLIQARQAAQEQVGGISGGSPDVQDLRRQAEKQATDGALRDFFGADVQPPASGGTDAGPQIPLPDSPMAPASPEDLGQLPNLTDSAEAAKQAATKAALEAATRTVMVNPGDTLTGLIDAAGGDAYGADFTNTVLKSADVLTGPQNPNRDMARALVEFVKTNPGVNWRDAINGVGDWAKETVGGVPLKDAIAQATRMIYPGQEMKVVVGAGVP